GHHDSSAAPATPSAAYVITGTTRPRSGSPAATDHSHAGKDATPRTAARPAAVLAAAAERSAGHSAARQAPTPEPRRAAARTGATQLPASNADRSRVSEISNASPPAANSANATT